MKIKKLSENAIIPTYGSEQAAGMDLYTAEDVIVRPGATVLVHTGIAVEIPEGYFGGIYARSGLAAKRGLRPANCTGVIDSDYRGEVMVAIHNDSNETQRVLYGERIAQMIVQKYFTADLEVVDELSATVRGDGGFGSTGV